MQLVHLNTLSSEYTIELLTAKQAPLHIVYFVKYDDTGSFMTLYPIQEEEGVDVQGHYFRGNYGSRV